jgi:polar amino acid transport system substrate-binding protein
MKDLMVYTQGPLIGLLCAVSLSLWAADLAPTGTLRASFLGLNPVQGKVDPVTHEVSGPVADLVKELARRLNVPYRILPESDARHVIDDLNSGAADIGFLANDPARAAEVDFTEPYALMFNAFVVPTASKIVKTADADRAGITVGAVRGQTQELFLSSHLKQARVKVFDTMPPQNVLEELFANHDIDAFGVNRQRAEEAAASKNLRALVDDFLVVEQSLIVMKNATAASKVSDLNRFLRDIRASGFVKGSLDRAKISGVAVAPIPAPVAR